MLRRVRDTAVRTITATGLAIGAFEMSTNLVTQGRSSEFYHYCSDQIVTPMLRRFLSPEDAHNMALYFIQKNLSPTHHPNVHEATSRVDLSTKLHQTKNRSKSLLFPNCIGLAAGFDKDGVAIRGLQQMGFGFVEIGSVTPLPQPGNPKPRMFRLIEDGGVINRFGFNSVGMDAVEENLKSFRGETPLSSTTQDSCKDDGLAWLPQILQSIIHKSRNVLFQTPSDGSVLLGVNLGKNKLSKEETKDYENGIQRLGMYADYLVVNISSPNTPGLRDLQQSESLRRLINACLQERDKLESPVPLFVKIAPDLTRDHMKEIATVIMESGVDGILVSNTTNQRPETLSSGNKVEAGGLSGSPLKDISTECIRQMYHLTNGEVFIVGIGGVGSGQDAYEKMKAGASVVQIYSRMVYEGPGIVSRIRKELAELMIQNGQKCTDEIVGLDHDGIYWKKRLERVKQTRQKESMIVDM